MKGGAVVFEERKKEQTARREELDVVWAAMAGLSVDCARRAPKHAGLTESGFTALYDQYVDLFTISEMADPAVHDSFCYDKYLRERREGIAASTGWRDNLVEAERVGDEGRIVSMLDEMREWPMVGKTEYRGLPWCSCRKPAGL